MALATPITATVTCLSISEPMLGANYKVTFQYGSGTNIADMQPVILQLTNQAQVAQFAVGGTYTITIS